MANNELRKDMDAVNERVYHTVNSGAYRAGFATVQDKYPTGIVPKGPVLSFK